MKWIVEDFNDWLLKCRVDRSRSLEENEDDKTISALETETESLSNQSNLLKFYPKYPS
jgi:hypothetical protein